MNRLLRSALSVLTFLAIASLVLGGLYRERARQVRGLTALRGSTEFQIRSKAGAPSDVLTPNSPDYPVAGYTKPSRGPKFDRAYLYYVGDELVYLFIRDGVCTDVFVGGG